MVSSQMGSCDCDGGAGKCRAPGPRLKGVQCVRFVSAAQLTVFFTSAVPSPVSPLMFGAG